MDIRTIENTFLRRICIILLIPFIFLIGIIIEFTEPVFGKIKFVWQTCAYFSRVGWKGMNKTPKDEEDY